MGQFDCRGRSRQSDADRTRDSVELTGQGAPREALVDGDEQVLSEARESAHPVASAPKDQPAHREQGLAPLPVPSQQRHHLALLRRPPGHRLADHEHRPKRVASAELVRKLEVRESLQKDGIDRALGRRKGRQEGVSAWAGWASPGEGGRTMRRSDEGSSTMSRKR